MLFSLGQRADASTDRREFTSPKGRKCVTYIFSWPLSNCSSTVGTFVCYLCIMLIALFFSVGITTTRLLERPNGECLMKSR